MPSEQSWTEPTFFVLKKRYRAINIRDAADANQSTAESVKPMLGALITTIYSCFNLQMQMHPVL